MSIQTDSTALEDPKDWSTCNLFAIYKLLASANEVKTMKLNYENGGFGYGHAKQALFELIITKFAAQRESYHYYMSNLSAIDDALMIGATKAKIVANNVLERVRTKVGY